MRSWTVDRSPESGLAAGATQSGLAASAGANSAQSGLAASASTQSLLQSQTHKNAPSEPVTFADKRRRLLSTPLITGYYVTDRPPDGQSHNSKAC